MDRWIVECQWEFELVHEPYLVETPIELPAICLREYMSPNPYPYIYTAGNLGPWRNFTTLSSNQERKISRGQD